MLRWIRYGENLLFRSVSGLTFWVFGRQYYYFLIRGVLPKLPHLCHSSSQASVSELTVAAALLTFGLLSAETSGALGGLEDALHLTSIPI